MIFTDKMGKVERKKGHNVQKDGKKEKRTFDKKAFQKKKFDKKAKLEQWKSKRETYMKHRLNKLKEKAYLLIHKNNINF